MYALGIPNVGAKTARDLADRYGSLEALMAADSESLLEIDEVGDIVAASIVTFFQDPDNWRTVERLLEAGVCPSAAPMPAPASQGLAGEIVVVTGTLETLSRKDAEAAILQAGGEVGSGITRKTTLLVAGENAGSKLEKAQKQGIPILDEAAFLRRIQA